MPEGDSMHLRPGSIASDPLERLGCSRILFGMLQIVSGVPLGSDVGSLILIHKRFDWDLVGSDGMAAGSVSNRSFPGCCSSQFLPASSGFTASVDADCNCHRDP